MEQRFLVYAGAEVSVSLLHVTSEERATLKLARTLQAANGSDDAEKLTLSVIFLADGL